MESFLAFSGQRKAQCVTYYHQTRPSTQTQRHYKTTYAQSSPTKDYILRWVHTLGEHGRAKNTHAFERPVASSGQDTEISFILCDTQADPYDEQSKIRAFNKARLTVYS